MSKVRRGVCSECGGMWKWLGYVFSYCPACGGRMKRSSGNDPIFGKESQSSSDLKAIIIRCRATIASLRKELGGEDDKICNRCKMRNIDVYTGECHATAGQRSICKRYRLSKNRRPKNG